jgi:hypothetical protein
LFGIQVSLQVLYRRTELDVRGARPLVPLSALLIRPGQAFPADTPSATGWDGSPRDGVTATLRSHVMRLRRALGSNAGNSVADRHPGYLTEAGEREAGPPRFAVPSKERGAAAGAPNGERAAAIPERPAGRRTRYLPGGPESAGQGTRARSRCGAPGHPSARPHPRSGSCPARSDCRGYRGAGNGCSAVPEAPRVSGCRCQTVFRA